MENEELRELKREIYKEIDGAKREFNAYKMRISIIANLFIPGIGFVIYGKSFLKGIVSFVLFVLYNILFFKIILPNTDIAFIYYIPAVVIWIVSAAMVSGLDD